MVTNTTEIFNSVQEVYAGKTQCTTTQTFSEEGMAQKMDGWMERLQYRFISSHFHGREINMDGQTKGHWG